MVNKDNLNFSFSGIKTYINLLIKKNELDDNFKNNLCASFQKTIKEIIITKLINAISLFKQKNIFIRSISIVGGVANNQYIRKNLEMNFDKENINIYYPLKEMMSDNAAMIAWACIKNYRKEKNDIFFKSQPRMQVKSQL